MAYKNYYPKEASNIDQKAVVLWILLAQLLAIAPLFQLIPWWITLIALGVLVWRALVAHFRWPLPSRLIAFLVGLLGAVLVFQSYGTLVSRNAGLSLIVLMFTLKLLEMRAFRDAMLILFLCYFLLVVNFLYNENILVVAYLFASVFVITFCLIILNAIGEAWCSRKMVSLTGKIIGLSLPLAILLFLFFPRLSSPLWQIPGDSLASSGFSDSMSPGSISELFESDEIAFRVKQDGDMRGIANAYWRGLVLTQYDGLTWRQPDFRTQGLPEFIPLSEAKEYIIFLEPHEKKWLFTREISVPRTNQMVSYGDFTMESKWSINSLFVYRMLHYERYEFEKTLSETQRQANVALPDDFNPKIRAWSQDFRQTADSDQAFIDKVLDYIRQNQYFYTLRPPIYKENIMDDFWLTGQRGYCEHYASAFVHIMRAANIPARVVTGYSGGEFNPYGEYVIVRAKDAHAWTEVWIEGQGWRRVDPTAAIHPSRVEQDLTQQYQRRSSIDNFDNTAVLNNYVQTLSKTKVMKFLLDSIQNGWNEWFLDFDADKQLSLFSQLGFDIHSTLDLFKWMILLALLVLLVFGLLLIRNKQSGDALNKAFLAMERRLAKKNQILERELKEAPLTYLNRVKAERPDLAKTLVKIAEDYSRLRYQKLSSAARQTMTQKVLREIKSIA